MPTSSSAQPMMAFSSPLLSSVDRMLRGFDSRFGSVGFLSTLNRFESFTDRLLGRHLSSLGLPIQSSGFAPRDLPPVPALEQPESWIASPANATAKGTARAAAATTTAAKPGSSRMLAVGMPMVPASIAAPPGAVPVAAPSAAAASTPMVSPALAPAAASTAAPTASPMNPSTVSAADVVAPLSRGLAPSERARTIMPELADAAPAVPAASDTDEPRGLDLVLRAAPAPAVQRPPSLELMRLSALARSFQHVGWSDARLGLGQSAPAVAASSRAGSLHQLDAALASEPSLLQSARIASGAALSQTMVTPDALGTRTTNASPVSSRLAPSVPRPGAVLDATGRHDVPVAATLAASAATPSVLAPPSTSDAAALVQPSAVAASSLVHGSVEPPLAIVAPSATVSGAAEATSAEPAVSRSAIAPAFASAASRAVPSLVPERTVTSSRRAVVAEMADLLGPWSPGLSSAMWLGETVSKERAATSVERSDGRAAPRALAKPLTAPGQISSKIEQFAAQLGLATGLPLPSPDRPHAAAQWSHAPGLASSVQRLLLEQANSAGAVEGRALPSLPMLAAPTAERAVDKLPSGSRTVTPSTNKPATKLPRQPAVSGLPMDAVAAIEGGAKAADTPVALRHESVLPRPLASPASLDRRVVAESGIASEVSPDSPSVPPLAAAPLASPPSATVRPWQRLGGVATLAELFAAGVGLSSGAAQRAAESVGLSLAPSVLPSWLSIPSRFSHAPSETVPSWVAPSLSYLASESAPPVAAGRSLRSASPAQQNVQAGSPSARRELAAVGDLLHRDRTVAFSPSESSQAETASASPIASSTTVAATAVSPWDAVRSAVRPTMEPARTLGQVGALAASTEAFARSHGIARIEELVGADASSLAAPSRFVSLSGGQVLVSSDIRRTEGADHGGRQSDTATMDAPASARRPAASLPSLQPAWQRPGGMALRSELLATQMTGLLPWTQPSDAKQWQKAPGLPSSFAQLLASSESQDVLPRWAMGPQGLLFVAAPQSARASSAPQAPARDAGALSRVSAPSQPIASSLRLSTTSSAADSSVMARVFDGPASMVSSLSSQAASSSLGQAEVIAGSSVPSGGLRSIFGASASALPWLHVGGMGALAELFAAGVGVGTGAAQSVAQSLGVSSGRSLTPEWLLGLAERAGGSELATRFSAMLPSLVLPSVARPADAQTEASARPAKPGAVAQPSLPAAAREPSATARPSLGSLLTGGLAASAESFARHFGIERITGSASTESTADSSSESEGRWLSVAGGMVFLPNAQSAQSPSDARHALARVTKSAIAPSLPVGQLGATALRSEIFSALLGPQRTLSDIVGRSSPSALTGWDDLSSLLVSLPRAQVSSEPALPRWGLSGTGGLMFVGAPSRTSEHAGSPLRAEKAVAQRRNVMAKNDSAAWSLPGSLTSMAESVATRSATMAPSAQHLASPLLSLVAGPSDWKDARRGVSDVENAYSQRVLTSFPRQAQASGAESTPTSLWPRAMLSQVQRLEKVVSMLPSEWQPSLKVVAALRQSGVAQTPLWQELPKALSSVKPYETADDGDSSPSSFAQVAASALRSPSLSMVNRPTQPEPSARPAPVQSEASKQQSVERAMSEAVASLIKSGGQAAASARLLDAIRSHATNQPTRSDDRLNLSDLTMIALSMGQNRIAASSPDHPKDRLEPNVGNALRMKQSKHVEDDKNSYRKTVSEHAEQVVKYMKDQLEKSKMRGQF